MGPAMLIVGILALILGGMFIAGWFDWLLDVLGFILVIGGVIAIVVSLFSIFSGRNRG